MIRKLVIVGLLLCSSTMFAQQNATPASAEDIQKLIEVMHVRKQIETMQTAMVEQMKKGASAAFLQQYPHAKPELIAKVEGVFTGLYTNLIGTDEYLNAIVPIYRKYLSHDDVTALVAFYSSPAGQHFVDVSPQMMQEAAAAGGDLMKARMDGILARAEQQQKDLIDYVRQHPELTGESSPQTPIHGQESSNEKK